MITHNREMVGEPTSTLFGMDNRQTLTMRSPPYLLKVTKTLRYHWQHAVRGYRSTVWPFVKPHYSDCVFIVGCSRSGTTLVYKTLSLARELASLNRETHAFWNSLHPPAENDWADHILTEQNVTPQERARVFKYFYLSLGNRPFVDKANQNGFRIGYLNALFPNARFLFVKRDGPDNIHSLIQGWHRPAEYGDWAEQLPAHVAVDQGQFTRWCFFLYPGWRDDLHASIEHVCAKQWSSINEAILTAKEDVPSDRWVEVAYEDLLRNPVSSFRDLFAALGLHFGEDIEHHCSTVIERPYNAFSKPRLNKWREAENADKIETILPKIASIRERLGYSC